MQLRNTATPSPTRGVNPRRAIMALLPAVLLAGCGSSPTPKPDLEERLAAVEAKAEQAEKRSKEALDMALSAGTSSTSGGAEEEGFGDDPLANEVIDGGTPPPGNQQGYQMIPAPPPGPQGQPMLPGQ